MDRKPLALLLAVFLAVSLVSVSFAAFDPAVFDENELFQVRFDTVVGAGNIAYLKGQEMPIGKLVSANDDFHFISFDIVMLPKAPAVMRANFAVAGTLINAKELTLLTEQTRYTLKVDSNPSTSVYEGITAVFTPDLFALFEEIIANQTASVKFRLSGDYDIEGDMPINLEPLQTLYDLYIKAGGQDQDFSQTIRKYPVEIEQLDL